MRFWVPFALIWALILGYASLSDSLQEVHGWTVVQAHFLIVCVMLFMEVGGDRYRKIAAGVLVLYAFDIAATDWFIDYLPSWFGWVEVGGFLLLLGYAGYRRRAIRRLPRAREVFRDTSGDGDGLGR